MKLARLYQFACVLVLMTMLPACRTTAPTANQPVPQVHSELLEQPYLFEIVRHLYRWYLDESEVERIIGSKHFTFWVRRLDPVLDAGDRSLLGEILLPQLSLSIKVKKADYTIEELDTVVKSQTFKITQVARMDVPQSLPASCRAVQVNMQDMRDYLFRTRNQQDFPDAVLIERLRQALRKQAAQEKILTAEIAAKEKMVHLAPLSPVANELWVFWEDGRKLFYFASDIDLANPAVWQHEALMARIFDLDQQVIVSHEEAPGSNRFLTRYQVSRAMFNCIVLGKRITIPPAEQP